MFTKLEIKRQIVHILLGITLVILLNFNLINSTVILVIFIIGLALSLSSRKQHIPIIYRFLKIFDRKEDFFEASYEVDFENFEQLNKAQTALVTLDPSVEIVFLDQKNFSS